MRLDQAKLSFDMDDDGIRIARSRHARGEPPGGRVHARGERAVATLVAEAYPERALLRCHGTERETRRSGDVRRSERHRGGRVIVQRAAQVAAGARTASPDQYEVAKLSPRFPCSWRVFLGKQEEGNLGALRVGHAPVHAAPTRFGGTRTSSCTARRRRPTRGTRDAEPSRAPRRAPRRRTSTVSPTPRHSRRGATL